MHVYHSEDTEFVCDARLSTKKLMALLVCICDMYAEMKYCMDMNMHSKQNKVILPMF